MYKLSGPLRGSASLLRHATRPAGAAPGAGSKEGDHPTIDIYIYTYLNDADKNLHLLAPQRKRFLFCIITSERGFLFLIKNLSRL